MELMDIVIADEVIMAFIIVRIFKIDTYTTLDKYFKVME